jgi:hypothetical protein
MAPVRGRITVDGQPLASGQVLLFPLDVARDQPQQGSGAASGAKVQDGNYEIRTGTDRGARLGKYKVLVTPAMEPLKDGKSPLNQRYSSDRTTPLSIEVVADPKPGAYDLELKP